MNLYHAIMKAADHIEKHPKLFNFSEIFTPEDCGTPGCALGWIAFFCGIKDVTTKSPIYGTHVDFGINRVTLPLGVTQDRFYIRMNDLIGAHLWMAEADACARGLRLYAEKYHSHEILKEAA